MLEGLLNIVVVLAILVVLVVVHEFGHFITARLAHVRVHEFGIGFPPRARILGRDQETIYTLNWIPIGGFVRLEGEEGDSVDPRSFVRQGLAVKLVILLAGVAMNFLLAWLIFSGIAAVADPVSEVKITCVQPGSPAAAAGLVSGPQTGTASSGQAICADSGQLIVAVDGKQFSVFDHFGDQNIPTLQYLRDHAGQTVSLTIRRADGTEQVVQATLRSPDEAAKNGALGIGVGGLGFEDVKHPPLEALAIGATRTVDASTLILRGLRDLVTNLNNPQVSGPIGIVQTVGDVRSQLPPVFLFYLIGLLSANLGVVNVLPFPPMDGGRMAVAIIQAVSGNRVSLAAERAVYFTGFVLLMALLVWISFFYIQRLPRT
jgi:regulator of sigma E protease